MARTLCPKSSPRGLPKNPRNFSIKEGRVFKKVASIEWTSQDGAVLYREVYDNGTKSAWISAGFDTNHKSAAFKMRQLKRRRVGQKVRV